MAEKKRKATMASWRYPIALWAAAALGGGLLAQWRAPSADEYWARAEGALRAGQIAQAELALRHVLAKREDSVRERCLLSQLAARQEDWRTAAALLEPIPDADPVAIAARVAEGDAWLRLHRARSAENCWRRAYQLDLEAREPRVRLLYLYALQLRRQQWTQKLWEMYDRGEAGLTEMLQLMISRHATWETTDPIVEIRQFVAADPEDTHSRRALGLYLMKAGRLTLATKVLRTACQRDQQNPENWLALAECLLAASDLDALEALWSEAPASIQDDAHYWIARGSWLLLCEQFASAVDCFDRALPSSLYNLELHHKLAQALRLTGEREKATCHSAMADALSKIERLCLSLHPGDWRVETVRLLATRCESLLLTEEARGWVRVGLAQAPADPSLLSLQDRLAMKPPTSSRHPPTWEQLVSSCLRGTAR